MSATLCEKGARFRREVMHAMAWHAQVDKEREDLRYKVEQSGRSNYLAERARLAKAVHEHLKKEYDSHRKGCPVCEGRWLLR